jgi:radical SAM protein with 4Fe4S-binding SPASM domain
MSTTNLQIESLSAQESFCIIPWVHMYYFTDGYVYPCPAVAGDETMRYGKTTDSKLELWNSTTAKNLRLQMIENKPIVSCQRECGDCLNSCKKYFGNDILEQNRQVIERTKPDGESDYNFVAWNVIESNLCNLKCKYCSSNYSNLWDTDSKGIKTVLSETDFKALYLDNLDTAQEIWFASGEPVLQHSTYTILNNLINANKTHVRIRFITNLMKTGYRGQNIYELLQQFSDVIVFGSWDLNGERGEYIRTNSCSATIKKTIKEINSKGIPFILQSVMSIFNLYYYPEFHKELYEEGLVKKDNIRYYNLHYPFKYRYSILPLSVKQKIETKMTEYKQWLGDDLDPFPNRETPLTVIDKIIETMYTGKWGHWGFSEQQNKHYYKDFLQEQTELNSLLFLRLFRELIN